MRAKDRCHSRRDLCFKKALEQGVNPILLINKIDKKDARIDAVIDMSFDLFVDLGANEEQLI